MTPIIRVILHPTDFSSNSRWALRFAFGMAQEFGARLVVMHAYTPSAIGYGQLSSGAASPESRVAMLDRKLREFHMPGAAVPIEYRLVEGFAAQAILKTAAEFPVDLIVLGTHGRTGLRRLLMGSVAEEVLRHAACPVLTVKAPPEETPDDVKASILERFANLAREPQLEHRFPVGADSARRLGYDPHEVDSLPASVTESFAGVGNPLALGQLRQGQTVLDLGCGAGLDSLLAARKIGPTGKVIGVDFSAQMIQKAIRNASAVGISNVEFRQADADEVPLEGGSVDVVISNGVLNLCLDKPKVLAEAFRVLRPGGRMQMTDILLEDGVTPEEVARKGAWSD